MSNPQTQCTCGPRDTSDPEYLCAYCEHVQDWSRGKRGDPSCTSCNGHGHYTDGDGQWQKTCECVGNEVEQTVEVPALQPPAEQASEQEALAWLYKVTYEDGRDYVYLYDRRVRLSFFDCASRIVESPLYSRPALKAGDAG